MIHRIVRFHFWIAAALAAIVFCTGLFWSTQAAGSDAYVYVSQADLWRSSMKQFTLVLASTLLLAPARAGADTHQFISTVFYNTYSFAHPPALRIKPGDRVVTRTIDAAGVDWNGKTVATGPNPQTGPWWPRSGRR